MQGHLSFENLGDCHALIDGSSHGFENYGIGPFGLYIRDSMRTGTRYETSAPAKTNSREPRRQRKPTHDGFMIYMYYSYLQRDSWHN